MNSNEKINLPPALGTPEPVVPPIEHNEEPTLAEILERSAGSLELTEELKNYNKRMELAGNTDQLIDIETTIAQWESANKDTLN